MPYSFKGAVPKYPNAETVTSMHLKDGCFAEFHTVDSPGKVWEFYRACMTEAGWSVRVSRQSDAPATDSGNFLAFFKGPSGLMIDAMKPKDGKKTLVQIFMGDENA